MVGGVRKDSLLSGPLAGPAGPGDRGAASDLRQPGRPEEWHCGRRYLPGGHGEVGGRCRPDLSSCVLRAGGADWWSIGDTQGPVGGRTRDSRVGVQQGPQRGQADHRLVSGRDSWLTARSSGPVGTSSRGAGFPPAAPTGAEDSAPSPCAAPSWEPGLSPLGGSLCGRCAPRVHAHGSQRLCSPEGHGPLSPTLPFARPQWPLVTRAVPAASDPVQWASSLTGTRAGSSGQLLSVRPSRRASRGAHTVALCPVGSGQGPGARFSRGDRRGASGGGCGLSGGL